jgi:predicted TIM-barrel fold metal-dependent hydrolase
MTILCAHMGGVGHHDLSAAMIEFALQCPNLHLIGSAVRELAVMEAIGALGAQRVSFGSDTPFALMHVRLAMYRAMLADGFTDEQRADVLGGNIARIFGLGR